MRRRWPIGALVIAALLGAAIVFLPWRDWLYAVTGEEEVLPQLRGGAQWAFNWTRPLPHTADDVPVAPTGPVPFGVNTFLNLEVEPAKRERSLQMIADAGFRWIRQEFTWEDIEIHGKGDFEDRRHEPYRSAWEKYDQIVALAEAYDLGIIARLSNPPPGRARSAMTGVPTPRPTISRTTPTSSRRWRAATKAGSTTTSSGMSRTSTPNGAISP